MRKKNEEMKKIALNAQVSFIVQSPFQVFQKKITFHMAMKNVEVHTVHGGRPNYWKAFPYVNKFKNKLNRLYVYSVLRVF